ncbi:MAG: KpsF/GutQ family sugar-phosphate isomerase [Verrucomicrobia bacterium]|nr:KpsF/GutQ family sugar-phosphate isomerase [Verrucomicrobiota bacterium]
MLDELLQQQRSFLAHYFDHLDLQEVQAALEMCLNTKGLIIFTGVGKSGIIAEKIAMTLVSTGTKALYLPPTNFLHGDIGILGKEDLFILMSRSGEAEELLSLVPFAKRREARTLAVVCNPQSRLARACDLFVNLPFEKELCPFDLAPTTSTAVQLLFGDLLAVALMRSKQFDLSTYALNHPSGAIGKKMHVLVDEIMYTGDQIPLARPCDKLLDVLVELSNKKCGALLIADEEGQFCGIFTDGDLRRALQTAGSDVLQKPMSALMTRSALHIEKGVLAWEALRLMQRDPKRLVMVLPVLDKGKVAGVLRMHEIVQSGIA